MKVSPWSLVTALLVPMTLVGCAVDAPSGEGDENEPAESVQTDDRTENGAAATENVAQSQSDLKLDHSRFCLPGEVVKCTLGPPPVCRCVPQPVEPPVLIAW